MTEFSLVVENTERDLTLYFISFEASINLAVIIIRRGVKKDFISEIFFLVFKDLRGGVLRFNRF